jgi:hypothetical protein
MEEVEMARMNKLNDVLEVRNFLHNYIDFALGERLKSIKQALPEFWPNRPEKKVKRSRSQTSATVSVSELRFDLPMTPASVGENMAVKRTKRTLDDVSN